jgi:hypothetical protein
VVSPAHFIQLNGKKLKIDVVSILSLLSLLH